MSQISTSDRTISACGIHHETKEDLDAPTASTNSTSCSSDTAFDDGSMSNKCEQAGGATAPHENPVILQRLASQLEYYFSRNNLSKDIYLQTLRDLNDGCVPVQILANFSKVRSIVSTDLCYQLDENARINAILSVVKKGYSSKLKIHFIDTSTGKIFSNEIPETPVKTILALGTVSTEPLDLVATQPSVGMSYSLSKNNQNSGVTVSNTIIIRDAIPSVTEADVYDLFNTIPSCPPIVGVTRDVANCWFITLDTDENDLMMGIMMKLRSMTLGGEYAMARLKASSPRLSVVDVYSSFLSQNDSTGSLESSQRSTSNKKKKKKARSKRNRNRKNSLHCASERISCSKELHPSLPLDEFPSLQGEQKVEWEVRPGCTFGIIENHDPDSKSEGSGESPKSIKGFSDGASTATTASSSVDPRVFTSKPIGGYVAALLKPPVPTRAEPRNVGDERSQPAVIKNQENKKKADLVISHQKGNGLAPVWGSRSFADIVREINTGKICPT